MAKTTKTKSNTKISFRPKQVVSKLLSILDDRAKDVVISRFGLGDDTSGKTLESIGKKYGITRERVRQIENYALNTIRESDVYQKNIEVFDELRSVLDDLGGIIVEYELLNLISQNQNTKNQIHFLLVVGEFFYHEREDQEFYHSWNVDHDLAVKIKDALRKLYQNIETDELVPESEIISSFFDRLKDVSEKYKDEEVAKRWLSLSKKIDKNPLGEWGRTESPNVNAKGMRDYAYLVIRKHGSPIHFREVAQAIEKYFDKKAHVATTHNELIKDPRFVLVGRGLYALSEWGYINGVVKDVIKHMVENYGPMTKDEIIEKVLKERYVKENTIMVNLQDSEAFSRDEDGLYRLV